MTDDAVVYPSDFVEGPCDNCELRQRCAERHLACKAYAVWMDGKGKKRWQHEPREPTRAKFRELFRKAA